MGLYPRDHPHLPKHHVCDLRRPRSTERVRGVRAYCRRGPIAVVQCVRSDRSLMPDHPQLTNRLAKRRKAAGWTQGELAERISVSRKSVNTIENGIFIPSTVLAL